MIDVEKEYNKLLNSNNDYYESISILIHNMSSMKGLKKIKEIQATRSTLAYPIIFFLLEYGYVIEPLEDENFHLYTGDFLIPMLRKREGELFAKSRIGFPRGHGMLIDDNSYKRRGKKRDWTTETCTIGNKKYHVNNNLNEHTSFKVMLWLYEVTQGAYFIKEEGNNRFIIVDSSSAIGINNTVTEEALSTRSYKVQNNRHTHSVEQCTQIDETIKKIKGTNVIFFGAPGTGKSHKINTIVYKELEDLSCEEKAEFADYHFGKTYRVTFHPEMDCSNFIGCYKPIMEGEKIEYTFVPQAFMKAYISAWKKFLDKDEKNKQVYLVIEELNRGNCAQIFGDIFQLLDRDKEGKSKYLITPASEIIDWMKSTGENNEVLTGFNYKDYKEKLQELYKKEDDAEIIEEGVLALPSNLTVFATMNTSDQSLYPMDSAFKRRWEWKYVKVDYKNEDAKKKKIVFSEGVHNWIDALEAINMFIKEKLRSTDKQMGEFFINPDSDEIPYADFRDKVLFYLFNDAFKDDPTLAKDIWGNDGKYNQFIDLFEDDGEKKIYEWLNKLKKQYNDKKGESSNEKKE